MSQITDQTFLRDSFRTERDSARIKDAIASSTARSRSASEATQKSAVETMNDSVRVSLSEAAEKAAAEAEEEAAALESDPRVEALERKKNQAREALERIREEIKLVRKAWQYQPQEMAKQIVRLAGELKEALDLYKSAQKDLAKLQGGMGGGLGMAMAGLSGLAIPAASAPAEEEAGEDEVQAADPTMAEAGGEAESAETENLASEDEAVPAEDAVKAYGKQVEFERIRLDQTAEAYALKGDMDFVNAVRGLTKELRDAFGDVQRWAISFDQDDEDSRKLYEFTGKTLKALEKEIDQYEADIRKAMPPAIWVSRPITA